MMKICLLILVAIVGVITSLPITNLPGYQGPNLNMDSGYITVDEQHGRKLFYWHFEALENPDNAPLVFWFQGGPGCSGLFGLFTEHGPLDIVSEGQVRFRSITWARIANMVYLEAPAGVGFSYSNDPNDYNTNDQKTAADNYVFVQRFIEAFPQYAGRDVWFAGESYAGVYIPTLTNLVLSNSSTALYHNFQGFMAGNPVFRCESLNYADASINLLYWHALVSYANYDAWNKNGCAQNSTTKVCGAISNEIIKEIGVIDQELGVDKNQPSLDPDDLYQDFCLGNGTLSYALTNGWPDNCQPNGERVSNYLNTADVQTAIHARPTVWTACTDKINYTTNGASMVPLYKNFPIQKPGVKILVYSGDVDILTVPFGYTKPCLAELNRPVKRQWGPWFHNTATAGYWEQFDTYTYATLKGAGHEAPLYQPFNSYAMFSRFLNNQTLDEPNPQHLLKARRFNALKQSDLLRRIRRQIH